jgi:hypothetical protein
MSAWSRVGTIDRGRVCCRGLAKEALAQFAYAITLDSRLHRVFKARATRLIMALRRRRFGVLSLDPTNLKMTDPGRN